MDGSAVPWCSVRHSVAGPCAPTMISSSDAQDRTLVLLGFGGALRRSELPVSALARNWGVTKQPDAKTA